jgi:lysozyme
MKISAEGLQLIKDAEGLRLKAYKCSAGVWTIGFGTTSATGLIDIKPTTVINTKQAESLLTKSLANYEDCINECVKVELKQSQYDALVCFCYNIGCGAFKKSTLLKKLNKGDYSAVPSELMKWTKAGGKQVTGLVNRRTKEAALWSSDEWEADEEPNMEQQTIARDVPSVVNKENISFAAGIVGTAATPLATGNPPIQWAIAAIMVIGFAVGLFLFVKRRGM